MSDRTKALVILRHAALYAAENGASAAWDILYVAFVEIIFQDVPDDERPIVVSNVVAPLWDTILELAPKHSFTRLSQVGRIV